MPRSHVFGVASWSWPRMQTRRWPGMLSGRIAPGRRQVGAGGLERSLGVAPSVSDESTTFRNPACVRCSVMGGWGCLGRSRTAEMLLLRLPTGGMGSPRGELATLLRFPMPSSGGRMERPPPVFGMLEPAGARTGRAAGDVDSSCLRTVDLMRLIYFAWVRAAMNDALTRTSWLPMRVLGIRQVRTPGPLEKYSTVDGVHILIVFHVLEIDMAGDDVVELQSGRVEDRDMVLRAIW